MFLATAEPEWCMSLYIIENLRQATPRSRLHLSTLGATNDSYLPYFTLLLSQVIEGEINSARQSKLH